MAGPGGPGGPINESPPYPGSPAGPITPNKNIPFDQNKIHQNK